MDDLGVGRTFDTKPSATVLEPELLASDIDIFQSSSVNACSRGRGA